MQVSVFIKRARQTDKKHEAKKTKINKNKQNVKRSANSTTRANPKSVNYATGKDQKLDLYVLICVWWSGDSLWLMGTVLTAIVSSTISVQSDGLIYCSILIQTFVA